MVRSMSNTKVKNLMDAQRQVIGAWLHYLNSLGKFQCRVSKNKTVVNETGAHIVGGKQEKCEFFNVDVECNNKTCPNKPYNTKIIGDFNVVKNAIHERNLAFWDVLGMKEFIVNRTSYKDITGQVRKQKRQVQNLRNSALDASELITAVPVNHDTGAMAKPGSRLHCVVINPHNNWSEDECGDYSKHQYCKRIQLIAAMANMVGTAKDAVNKVANSDCLIDTSLHIQYAKMHSRTEVPPAEKDGIKYADFSQVDLDDGAKIIVIYESVNRQWVRYDVIWAPKHDGYVPIENAVWDAPELDAYKDGREFRVFWNAKQRCFTACPPICAGFGANMAYIDNKNELINAENTYNELLEKRRVMRYALRPRCKKK